MNYKIITILICFLLLSCEQTSNTKVNKKTFEIENRYKNSGFALVYTDDLKDIKNLISK